MPLLSNVFGSLIVVSGLPGVGKTAVAAGVATRLGGVHLSVDPVEDAMLGAGLARGWTVGVAAYEAVRAMAEVNLAVGRTVVVDAVNDSEEARRTWRRAVSGPGASLTFVVLTCSDLDEHRRRLEGRRRGFAYLPEPTWARVLERSRTLEPWKGERLEVDTAAIDVTEVCDRVCAAVESG